MRTHLPQDAVLASCVTMSFLICSGLLIYAAGRGIDLTDEIFYLIWARDPDAYVLNYQPFGYLLHPLFKLALGDLRVYRLMGFAISAGAGALLGYSVSAVHRTRLLPCLYGALSALTIFFPWIITPSYNSAANVGAMLAIAGILTVLADRPKHRIVGTFVTAAGLCVAAFSKPPLFAIAVAAILVTAFIAKSRRTTIALIVALALAALLIAAFLPPGGALGLIARIVASQHVLALPNAPLSLPAKIARDWLAVPPSLTGATLAAGASLAFWQAGWSKWLGYLAVGLSLFYAGSIATDAIDGSIPDFIGLAVVTAAAGYAGLLQRKHRTSRLAIWLMLGTPCAVALGTFNNQWAQLNFSMTFPLLALFVLASTDPLRWRRMAVYAVAVPAPAAIMLLAAWYPYSLPVSIFEQQTPVKHPLTQTSMLVDAETAVFIRSAGGLAQGELLVDLSGTGPGVAAVLGARAPVLPWLNPATATWPSVVWARLSAEQRERAWFVGPIWPLFSHSAPARWFGAHQSHYCRQPLPPVLFWGEQRNLVVWRPCKQRLSAL